MLARVRNRLQSDSGLTLIELLVVLVVSTVLGGVVLGTVVNAFEQERTATTRVEALNSAKLALERMTSDIRAADPLLAMDDDRIEMTVERAGEDVDVTYFSAVDAGQTVLRVTEETEASTATRLVVGGLGDDGLALSYLDAAGDPAEFVNEVRTVAVTIEAATVPGDAPEILSDEITLRNAQDDQGE